VEQRNKRARGLVCRSQTECNGGNPTPLHRGTVGRGDNVPARLYFARKLERGRPGNQDATQSGGAVIKSKLGAEVAGSWIRRAGNEKPPLPSADQEPCSVAASVPEKADQGWNPHEIWLRRIYQPRRGRAEDELQPVASLIDERSVRG